MPGKHRSDAEKFKRTDPNYTPRHGRGLASRIARETLQVGTAKIR